MGKPPGFTADHSLAARRGRYSNMKHYRPPMAANGVTLPASWVQLSQATVYGSAGAEVADGDDMAADDEAFEDFGVDALEDDVASDAAATDEEDDDADHDDADAGADGD